MKESSERAREYYRIRVRNCVLTIMDVRKILCARYGSRDFMKGFERLEAEAANLDMAKVSEGDILLVEQATNALLSELGKIFETGKVGPVYRHLKN